MSSPKERMLQLMAYADGELEGAELEQAQTWLAEDPNAVRLVNDVARLGDLVTLGHGRSEAAKSVASFDIADAVMAKVREEPKQGTSHGVTSSLDAARERKHRTLRGGATAAGVLALAASVLFMMHRRDEQPMARGPASTTQTAPNLGGGPGVEVDVVEAPGHSVSVFYLPNESSLTTTSVVVWVDETGGK